MGGSIFEQHFHGTVENVYNVNGDLILSSNSTRQDLRRELIKLRDQIEHLPGLASQSREELVLALNSAIAESQQPNPRGRAIGEHLTSAADTLKKVEGVALSGVKLAEIIDKIGKWAISLL